MHDRVTRGLGEVTVQYEATDGPRIVTGSAEDLRRAGALPAGNVLPVRIYIDPDLLAREKARSAAGEIGSVLLP